MTLPYDTTYTGEPNDITAIVGVWYDANPTFWRTAGDPLAESYYYVTHMVLRGRTSLDAGLAEVFRRMNVVDGNELPTKLGVRSMSVGDVVTIIGLDGVRRAYICNPVGWEEVDDTRFKNGATNV